MSKNQHFDLIIVGGGLVGASLAIALRLSGWRIALVDARAKSGHDPRQFALHAGSCQLLKNIGLWPMLKDEATPIKQVHVSRKGYFGALRLHHQDIDSEALGYVIPAERIETALNAVLETLPYCTSYRPATLKSLLRQEKEYSFLLDTSEGEIVLQAPLAIGADGTHSTVRQLLHMPSDTFDYGQQALVARIKLKQPHLNQAYERFVAQGAIAILPLKDNECVAIWSGDKVAITNLMSLSDNEFLSVIQKEFGWRLGSFQSISTRVTFPLTFVHAQEMSRDGILLMGNAAHTLHPVAAQGFNLALYEVATLIDTIQAKQAKEQSFTAQDLEQVAQALTDQQQKIITLSHRLGKMTGQYSFLMHWGLQLGMLGLNYCTPLRKKFLARIMGKAGRVPSLFLEMA